jgi:hypothetical protein
LSTTGVAVAAGESGAARKHFGGRRLARRERAERARQRVDDGLPVDVAEHVDLDRSLREQPRPHLLESLRSGLSQRFGRGRGEARIAVVQQPVEVAVDHAVGIAVIRVVGEQQSCLGPLDGGRIPPRHAQLGGEQVDLVGDVARPRSFLRTRKCRSRW